MPPSFPPFHFLAILFLLYLPLFCICECPPPHPLLFFVSLCDVRWCVGEKLNISSEIGFLWRNWWITLCSWREYWGLFMPCRQIHVYTHTYIHICKGERTRGLFMLKQNEFLWAIDCCLWGNTLLSCERCNLDCSMTNNELRFWRQQLQQPPSHPPFPQHMHKHWNTHTHTHSQHVLAALMLLLLKTNGLARPVNHTNFYTNTDNEDLNVKQRVVVTGSWATTACNKSIKI